MIATNSVLAKNVALLNAHQKEAATVFDGIIGATEQMRIWERWAWHQLIPRACLTDKDRDDC
jgi:hypothetical protein